jgi:hypothetical protein
MKDNRVRDILLSATTLENATADGYMGITVKELENHGHLDLLSSSKLLGIGPDGATNLIRGENGQIKKLDRISAM